MNSVKDLLETVELKGNCRQFTEDENMFISDVKEDCVKISKIVSSIYKMAKPFYDALGYEDCNSNIEDVIFDDSLGNDYIVFFSLPCAIDFDALERSGLFVGPYSNRDVRHNIVKSLKLADEFYDWWTSLPLDE